MASSIFNRIKSNPRVSQTLISNFISARSVYTAKVAETKLNSQISPLGNAKWSFVPVLDQRMEEGKKISERMSSKERLPFSPSPRVAQLDLISKVRGLESTETHFQKMKELGFASTTFPYNGMRLYSTTTKQPEMKEHGVERRDAANFLRPLSPHLPVYQPQFTSVFSIINRITGASLVFLVLSFYIFYVKIGLILFP